MYKIERGKGHLQIFDTLKIYWSIWTSGQDPRGKGIKSECIMRQAKMHLIIAHNSVTCLLITTVLHRILLTAAVLYSFNKISYLWFYLITITLTHKYKYIVLILLLVNVVTYLFWFTIGPRRFLLIFFSSIDRKFIIA